MMNFIPKIAKFIHSEELDLSHLTIVLPSERAKKYLTSALFDVYQKPLISPKMVTIDKWIKSYSPETVIDKTRALIKLYEIHQKEVFKSTSETMNYNDESFDEFIKWGDILLSDFNEIDRYLLDAKQVFKNLTDIKEIENWSFGEENLTEAQIRFMEFWDRLPGYYFALNDVLSKNSTCYSGKSFKYLANNIDVVFKEDKDHRFIFAGFNALSKAELSIIRQLETMGRADIFIDSDVFYLENKSHEAGFFLRELQAELGQKKLNFVGDNLSQNSLHVKMIECAQNTGQVKVASTVLSELSKERLNETLLLLADESLIASLLKNLPKSIGKANITLGLPIRNSLMKTWVELFFSIQENKKRFHTDAIYFNDIKDFTKHPFVLGMIDEEEKQLLVKLEQKIIQYNKIFVSFEHLEIGKITREILSLLVMNWKIDSPDQTWVEPMNFIRTMNQLMYKNLGEELVFEKAILEGFDSSLIDFQNIISEGIPPMGLKSFKQLFNQHWGNKSIAYHGNPLEGLQIMGLLETRMLDFKNIICIGMNEGKMPPTNPIQTMIPMDLRAYLGLPTPREKQGLFAHHFYRLLHSCEELTVTYTSALESIGSNEPSRYLMQLELELSRMHANIDVEKSVYTLKGEQNTIKDSIVKTPEIFQRLDDMLLKSSSASLFKTYTTCPLDFYFKRVMEFGEEKEVEEEVESSTFGTFIHNTLEILYTPFARFDKDGVKNSPAPTNITSYDVEKMLKEYELIIFNQFLAHFNNDKDAFLLGKNRLSFEMAKKLTHNFLKAEVTFLSEQKELVFIESLESRFEEMIEIEVNGVQKKVNLMGFVDRIDRVGNKIRIIDYKSGKVASTDVSFFQRNKKDSDEEVVLKKHRSLAERKHILQLTQYAYLYYKKEGVIPESSIISFISNNFKPFVLTAKDYDLEEFIENYPEYLGEILTEMYNDEIPFEHKDQGEYSYCKYC